MARPAPTCLDDDDRLRFPPVSPAQDSKAGKKESTGRRQSRLCPLSAKPSSNSSLDHRRSDARTAENGSATLSGVSKSAKVVLGRVLISFLFTGAKDLLLRVIRQSARTLRARCARGAPGAPTLTRRLMT